MNDMPSPAEFRERLLIDSDHGPVRLADVVEPWQRADFEALDSGWLRVAGLADDGVNRAWLERPRGHSKTSDIAISVAWALAFSPRQLSGVAAAADADQSDLLRRAIERLVRLNDWLDAILVVQSDRVVNRLNGSRLDILSSDAMTSYGLTPDFVVADELCHWRKRDLWDSLLSSAAKRAHCLLLVITNAGFKKSWQGETREAIRNAWYFHSLSGPQASWIGAATLDEQRRLLPDIAYRRLWLNEWSDGSGDALVESDISAALTQAGPTLEPERGWLYIAALDLGLTRDASALVLIGKHVGYVDRAKPEPKKLDKKIEAAIDLGLLPEPLNRSYATADSSTRVEGTQRVKLCQVHLWKPDGKTVDLQKIEDAAIEMHRRFGLAQFAYDPYQAAHLCQRLSRFGVPTLPVNFVPSALQSMATEVLAAFRDRTVDLYPHDQLLDDLQSLRVVEKSYGVRLESPRGPNGHGDCATALSMGLHVAKDYKRAPGPIRIDRPLLVY